MILNLASLPPSLQTAVIVGTALMASLISISICLWPRRDEPRIDEPASVHSKGELP
jgi:hypothetical protein